MLGHLLKWEYQSAKRSRSWLSTIRVQRIELEDLIEDNPSLQPYVEEALVKAYRKGRALAIAQSSLRDRTFPKTCPYNLAESLSPEFWPAHPKSLSQLGQGTLKQT